LAEVARGLFNEVQSEPLQKEWQAVSKHFLRADYQLNNYLYGIYGGE
jgi:hypothetical protein